jgi:hypothetical protein
VLEHAKRDEHGYVAIAHLRRRDEDLWDALAVGENSQPLVFWVGGDRPDFDDLVVGDDGSFLMVVLATPPGVQPAGLLTVPADTWGSPIATLITIVTGEGLTMVSPAAGDRPAPPPPPTFGREMLRSLLDQAADRQGDNFKVAEIQTADGGSTRALLDWDGRPLMFWIDMPGEDGERELMMAVSLPAEGGIIAMAVDESLRPLYSAAATAQRLGDGDGDQAPS